MCGRFLSLFSAVSLFLMMDGLVLAQATKPNPKGEKTLLPKNALSAGAIVQEPMPKPAPLTPEEIAKLTAPGAEHAALTKLAGDWNVTIKMGGGPKAIASEGTAMMRMTTGNRFLSIEYQAKGTAGPIDGTFTLGYDSRHQHYQLMATDSFGNYFVTSQGKRDAETNKLRLFGVDDDPMMKAMGLTKEFGHQIEFRGDDDVIVEVLFIDNRTPQRREIKAIEYHFTRKK